MGTEKQPSKGIGTAGELWVAATLLFQGIDEGYRVSTVDVDDSGTDLFLFKEEENAIKEIHEIQVKTARKTQKNKRAFFGMQRPLIKGMKNLERIYVFLFVPKNVKYCWVITEKEISDDYNIKPTVHNISFSVLPHTKEKGVKYRCNPEDLFSCIKNKI